MEPNGHIDLHIDCIGLYSLCHMATVSSVQRILNPRMHMFPFGSKLLKNGQNRGVVKLSFKRSRRGMLCLMQGEVVHDRGTLSVDI